MGNKLVNKTSNVIPFDDEFEYKKFLEYLESIVVDINNVSLDDLEFYINSYIDLILSSEDYHLLSKIYFDEEKQDKVKEYIEKRLISHNGYYQTIDEDNSEKVKKI